MSRRRPEHWINPHATIAIVAPQPTTHLVAADFTPRQRQVLSLLASGMLDKVIAGHLGISYETVRTHLATLRRRTGLRNRNQIALWWSALEGNKSGRNFVDMRANKSHNIGVHNLWSLPYAIPKIPFSAVYACITPARSTKGG